MFFLSTNIHKCIIQDDSENDRCKSQSYIFSNLKTLIPNGYKSLMKYLKLLVNEKSR